MRCVRQRAKFDVIESDFDKDNPELVVRNRFLKTEFRDYQYSDGSVAGKVLPAVFDHAGFRKINANELVGPVGSDKIIVCASLDASNFLFVILPSVLLLTGDR